MIEVALEMICGIGAMHYHRTAMPPADLRHNECCLSHACQAHLCQIVEVVVIDHQEPWTVVAEMLLELALRARKHGIEQCNGIPCLAHDGSSIQSSKRRIGHHRLLLLRIIRQEIAVSQQNISHGRYHIGAGFPARREG